MANDLNINVKVNGVTEANNNLKSVATQTKQTADKFKEFEKVAQPLGIALTSIGAAGLLAANATKDWNNGLGETLQKLKPVFAATTGLGVAIMVGVKAIKAIRVALDALKVTAFSTAGVMGILGASIGAVGLLVYGLTQLFPAMKADTERWSAALDKANDSLKELEDSGQGASAEANVLRDAIDDLTYSLARFDTVGDDNVVTSANLSAAIEKLADAKAEMVQIDAGVLDMMNGINEETLIGRGLWRAYDITIGDTAATVAELTEGVLDRKDAQIEAEEALRSAAISDLEERYGFRADEQQSLLDMMEEATAARQAALNDQLDSVRNSIRSEIDAYEDAYDDKVRLFNEETEARVKALQDQLDALSDTGEEIDRMREDEDDAQTEADLRAAIAAQWTRKGRAAAEEDLAKFLEERSRKLEDRKLDDQRDALQYQIIEFQDSEEDQRRIWERERTDFNRIKQQELATAETNIQRQLDALEIAAEKKEGILQREFEHAVKYQNAIRDNAIQAINDQIAAQLVLTELPPMATSGTAGAGLGLGGSVGGPSIPQFGLGVRPYATGGPILEPTLLYGLRSQKPYAIAGERGPEYISPSGGGDINITGTFYIREEADIAKVARELHRLRMRKGNMGSEYVAFNDVER